MNMQQIAILKDIIDDIPENDGVTDPALIRPTLYAKDQTIVREYRVRALGAMNLLGDADGATFLDGLKSLEASVPSIKWMLTELHTAGADVGNAKTRAMLQSLADNPAFTSLDQAKLGLLVAPSITTGLTRLQVAGLPMPSLHEITRALEI